MAKIKSQRLKKMPTLKGVEQKGTGKGKGWHRDNPKNPHTPENTPGGDTSISKVAKMIVGYPTTTYTKSKDAKQSAEIAKLHKQNPNHEIYVDKLTGKLTLGERIDSPRSMTSLVQKSLPNAKINTRSAQKKVTIPMANIPMIPDAVSPQVHMGSTMRAVLDMGDMHSLNKELSYLYRLSGTSKRRAYDSRIYDEKQKWHKIYADTKRKIKEINAAKIKLGGVAPIKPITAPMPKTALSNVSGSTTAETIITNTEPSPSNPIPRVEDKLPQNLTPLPPIVGTPTKQTKKVRSSVAKRQKSLKSSLSMTPMPKRIKETPVKRSEIARIASDARDDWKTAKMMAKEILVQKRATTDPAKKKELNKEYKRLVAERNKAHAIWKNKDKTYKSAKKVETAKKKIGTMARTIKKTIGQIYG